MPSEPEGSSGPANQGPAATPQPSPEARARFRIVSVSTGREPGSQVRVSVTLGLGDGRGTAEREGVGGRTVQLRLGAQATLEAMGDLLQREVRHRLVGVKTVRAFDRDLVLVGVRSPSLPSRQLLGGVPIGDDPVRAACKATLDAVNRVIDVADDEEDGGV